MESASGRLVAGLAVLVVVWIGAYWLYDPSKPADAGLARLTSEGSLPPAARNARRGEGTRPDRPSPDAAMPEASKPDARQAEVTPPTPVEPKHTPAAPAPRVAVERPEFDTYVVQAGDTFEKIAKAKLGSASLATVIKQANPMKDPRRLRAGDQIKIPRDPGNIQGKPTAAPPGSSPAAGAETYVVKPGDTLSGIASTLLGSSKHWKLILDANTDVLESPDKLKAGMRLRIPAKPE